MINILARSAHSAVGDERSELEMNTKQLEIEISLMNNELQQQQKQARDTSLKQLQSRIIKLESTITKLDNDDLTVDKTKDEFTALQKELSLLAEVSGVVLTDTTCKLLHIGCDSIERCHKMLGYCSEIAFEVDFVINEKQISVDESEVSVKDLKIKIDGEVSKQLTAVIPQLEQELAVERFFRVLTSCVRWQKHRHWVFAHLKHKYNTDVHLSDESNDVILQFTNSQKPGVLWIIHWDVVISESANVTPIIQLFVKASDSVVAADKDNFLSSAPAQFQTMLNTLGILPAMDAIIKTVTMS